MLRYRFSIHNIEKPDEIMCFESIIYTQAGDLKSVLRQGESFLQQSGISHRSRPFMASITQVAMTKGAVSVVTPADIPSHWRRTDIETATVAKMKSRQDGPANAIAQSTALYPQSPELKPE